jgi:hypothetical protein
VNCTRTLVNGIRSPPCRILFLTLQWPHCVRAWQLRCTVCQPDSMSTQGESTNLWTTILYSSRTLPSISQWHQSNRPHAFGGARYTDDWGGNVLAYGVTGVCWTETCFVHSVYEHTLFLFDFDFQIQNTSNQNKNIWSNYFTCHDEAKYDKAIGEIR